MRVLTKPVHHFSVRVKTSAFTLQFTIPDNAWRRVRNRASFPNEESRAFLPPWEPCRGSVKLSGTLFLESRVSLSKHCTVGEASRFLAPTNHTLLPLGFSKDFETFCGSLLCLGFARVIQSRILSLIKSQSLYISSTSSVLWLFHARWRTESFILYRTLHLSIRLQGHRAPVTQ